MKINISEQFYTCMGVVFHGLEPEIADNHAGVLTVAAVLLTALYTLKDYERSTRE